MQHTRLDFDLALWLADPAITRCRPSTRGVLIDLIGAMIADGSSGQVSGTALELARLARWPNEADVSSAINDARKHHAVRHAESNGRITLTYPPMRQAYLKRQMAAERQLRRRRKLGIPPRGGGRNAPVTPRVTPNVTPESRSAAVSPSHSLSDQKTSGVPGSKGNPDLLSSSSLSDARAKTQTEAASPQRERGIRNTVGDLWFEGQTDKPPPIARRVDRLVQDFHELGATPDDIRTRLKRLRSAFTRGADTPEALIKHWHRFGADRHGHAEGNGSNGAPGAHRAAKLAREHAAPIDVPEL